MNRLALPFVHSKSLLPAQLLRMLAVKPFPRFNPAMESFWLKAKGVLVVVGLAVLLAGCSRPLNFQVVLEKDSTVMKGTPVYVDAMPAGVVTSVGEEGAERVANLSIKSAPAKELMKVGAVCVPEDGRIQISTTSVKPDAVPMANGARIPTRSGVLDLIQRHSIVSALVTIGIAVLVALGIFLFFRSLVGAVGLIVSVALAGIIAHAVYAHAVPWVTRLYERFPPPAIADAAPPAPASQIDPGAAAGFVSQATDTIREVMVMRPDPRILTWCIVFIVLFIVINLLLGSVARIWRK